MEFASIEHLMASDDPQARKRAAFQLAELPPDQAAGPLVCLLKDANPAVSEAAQASLSLLGGSAAIQALIPLLSSSSAALRNAAIETLRRIGQDDLGLLHDLTKAADEHVRIFTVDILGSIASIDSLEPLCACLKDPNPNVRNAALISLGQLGDERALPQMQQLIDDEEWIRFTLIEAVAAIGGPAAAEFLTGQLERWGADDLTLSVLVEAIGTIGEPAGITPLLKLLPGCEEFAGLSLVRALKALLGPQGFTGLDEGLRARIREIVLARLLDEEDNRDLLEILAQVGDQTCAGVLLKLARTLDPLVDGERLSLLGQTMAALGLVETAVAMLDLEDHLKVLGAEILSLTGGQDQALIAALARTGGATRRSLVEALSRSQSPEAQACLKGLLADSDGHVAAIAIRTAAKWGTSADLDALGACLEHSYPDVRAAALDAICALDGPAAEKLLLARLTDGSDQARQLALEGLARTRSGHLAAILAATVATQPLLALRLARDYDVRLDSSLIEGLLVAAEAPVRQLAMELIGRQGLTALRPQLEAVLEGSDRRSAYQAVLALGRFRDERARATLLQALAQGPDLIKIAVLKAFADWDDPALIDELEPCLEDDNPDIAHACARVLEKLNGA